MNALRSLQVAYTKRPGEAHNTRFTHCALYAHGALTPLYHVLT
jgi:hypothetical protein